MVLSSEDFKGLFPSHIAVRTVSTSGVESVNSDVVTLPGQLIKELKEGSSIKGTERAKVSLCQMQHFCYSVLKFFNI